MPALRFVFTAREPCRHGCRLADARALSALGREAAVEHVYLRVNEIVHKQTEGRVWVESVEVRERGGNSALFSPA